MQRLMHMTCRIAFGAALALASTLAVHAQNYPTKPVRVVIGFAPGGPADIAGRAVVPKLGELLGQSFVIDNRGGAGGTIGLDLVAKAPPDGYTLALASSGNMIVAPLVRTNIPYNMHKDFAPIATLAVTSYVLAVNPTVPAKNAAELGRLAKSTKSKLTFGSSGAGSSSHVGGELLAQALGIPLVHVPYKGTGPALTAVVAGEIDMMVADLTPALPLAKSGRLRLLATVGAKRSAVAPDLPTMAESGVKMAPIDGRYGILAPAGTPKAIVDRLHGAILTALKAPDVRQRFQQLGFEIVGDSPEQFAETIKTQSDMLAPVVRKAGISSDG